MKKDLEIEIVEKIQSIQSPFLDFVMKAITLLGGSYFFVFLFLSFYYAYDKKFALNFVIGTTVASLFNYGLKNIVKRPRPYVQSSNIVRKSYSSGFSFASGHSVAAASNAWGICLTQKKKNTRPWVISAAVILCLLIAFSRLYLGHHFLSDVVVGLLIGAVLTPIFMWILNKFNFQMLFSIIFAIGGFVGIFLFTKHWFVETSLVNTFRACGGVCGLGVGMALEFKFVKLEVSNLKTRKHVLWVCAVSMLQSIALFAVLNLLPQLGIVIFPSLFVMGFFVTFVQMLLMKKIYQKLGAL